MRWLLLYVFVLNIFWDSAIVTDINIAIYVAPNTGKAIHNNRPFHGFVINSSVADKIIHFSDGTDLHTGPNELHYLPKGSSYRVDSIVSGGCWAINFDLLEEIVDVPFNIAFRNPDTVLKIFQDAVTAWNKQQLLFVRKSIYEIILKIKSEQQRNYLSSKKTVLIQPAIDMIQQNYLNSDLPVTHLAKLCGISDTYFRQIFYNIFSLNPKEYITRLRMQHAKNLLESNHFTVSEIALMCGYSEPCNFSREFSKNVGMSPAAYSKRKLRRSEF